MNHSDLYNPNSIQNDSPLADKKEFKIIDEEILVKRVFDTNPKLGCEILFQKYYKILCSHAIRFVYSKEVAEDIVSEIFCNFWSDQTYLNINTSYRAYLFKAVRFRSYNYVRWELSKDKKSVEVEDLHLAVSSLRPEQAMLYNDLSGEIERVISNLPPQCKKVFLLSRFENKKYLEIATELNISVKAVEAHISKALETLRMNLKACDLLSIILIGCFSAF